jgi:tetratricopeptide (TPR) repeat protein
MGAKVTISVLKPLVPLFEECLADQFEVIETSHCNIYTYDYHASLMSLLYIFKTDLVTIRNNIPYIFTPQPLPPEYLLASSDNYRIGIVWAGQINTTIYEKKSCTPELFLDLLDVGNLSLYSLQFGEDADKIEPWIDNHRIHDLTPLIKNFADTACMIEQLDLVITVDTAVAHLAGAMGKPVWVLLPFMPDWRWLLERQDSPWYPTMRLFRQPQRDDWESVFQQVKEKLTTVFKGESPLFPVTEIKSPAPILEMEIPQIARLDEVNEILQLGINSYHRGDIPQAEESLEKVLKLRPKNVDALHILGVIAGQRKEYEKATQLISQAIKIQPEIAEAHHNLGAFHGLQGDLQTAETHYQKAIQIQPNYASAYYNLGKIYHTQGKLEQAIASYQRTLELSPQNSEAWHNLAMSFETQGKLDQAIESYQQALQINPQNIYSHINLGNIFKEKGNLEQAIASYQRALQLNPQNVDIHNYLGVAFTIQGKLEQAIAFYQRALQLNPENFDAYNNLGNVLTEQGKLEQAIASYQQALKLKPDYADAHWNLSLVLLLIGDLERGWQEYEWRFHKITSIQKPILTSMWQGDSLEGKEILLWCEQGLGDSIQFIRYSWLLKQQGAKVVIATKEPLIRLFRECLTDSFEIINQKEANLNQYKNNISLMSLPKIFQTTEQTIPNKIPYLKSPSYIPSSLKLDNSSAFKIGIVWATSISNKNFYLKKSCSPKWFIDLLDLRDVSLYTLQVGEDANKIQPWINNNRIHDLSPLLKDFVDTACVIEQLDLVITVDTAVAHLAGAMGKPVWILIPFVPDWRWLLERQDTPWYPTMRLFRQAKRDDWESVFQQVKTKLTDVLQGISPIFSVAEIKSRSLKQTEMIPQGSSEQIDQVVQLGLKHYQAGDFAQAEALCQQILKMQSDNIDALHILGVIAGQRGEYQTAIQLINQAIQIKPEFIEANHNLAAFYTFQGDVAKAEEHYQKAIDLKPDYWDAHCHLGILYKDNLQLDKAIECLQRIIQLNPHYVKAHATLGHVLLLLGQFNQGFAEYEWRLQQEKYDSYKPETPMWDGLSSIEGKSIVLWNEQGLGDAIQFVRYTQKLKSMGAKVTLMVQPALISLFRECLSEKLSVLEQNKLNINTYDCHASIMSLPSILQTNLDNIPQEIPYIYPPQNKRPDCTLTPAASYQIGIVWASGNLNSALYSKKSCSPDLFVDLLNLGNVSLYSLQVGEDADKIKPWINNNRIHDLSPQLKNFVDTACVIEQLDLIITVDTAVAHLAGAMGKPVWVLLPFVPDWRWLLERQDTPWYPTMRLFRQTNKGDWLTVFQKVKEQLAEVLQGESPIFPIQAEKSKKVEQKLTGSQSTIVELSKRGESCYQHGDFEEAKIAYAQAYSLNPQNLDLCLNLAACHFELGELEEARQLFEKAITLQPDNTKAHYYLGMILLLCGELKRGWKEYEWISTTLNKFQQLPINLKWEGQSLTDKNIILWDEQGFGDTIQFIRYAPMVASLGAKVFLDVKSPLRRLFQANPSLGIVMDNQTSVQMHYWSRILSLPKLFGCELDHIENQIPYINPPSEAIVPPVLAKASKFKIGLVWKGSPDNSRNAIRSMELSLLQSLLLSSNCSFFSLHNQSCQEEIEAMALSDVIVDLADFIEDFADLAVIIEHLDLIITVDTAVAHLAGAMGKPVWVLLPFVPDWRWLLERQDTPWYPTMRLFRQPQRGDWESVIAQVQAKLVEVLQGESPLFPVERKSIFSMSQNSMSKTTNHQTVEAQLKLASELIDKNQLTQAQLVYEEILARDPQHLKSNFSLGWIHQQQGKFSQAIEYYHYIITIYPENIETLNNLGNIYQAQGNSEQAIAIYQKIVELQPHHPYGYYNLGVVYEGQNKFAEALELYQRAIAIDPRFIYAHYNLGNLYQKQSQLAKAIESYQKVVQIQPNYKNVYLTLGFLSQQLNQFAEAINYYHELIKLEPNIYSAYYNLGIIYQQQEDFSSAINYYQKAIAIKHDYSPAYNNLGRVYEIQGNFNQALECYQKAIQFQPNHAGAHLNKGLILLLLGKWKEGFIEYEWRFDSHSQQCNPYKPKTTSWDGSSIEDKSIVLWNEQGLGDALQFVRYAQQVKQRGAKVTLSVQSSLVTLFTDCLADQFEVVERKIGNHSDYDFHASLMSLPGIFHTKIDNIPNDNPYIFAPKPLRPDCILPPSDSYRIGIVWGGQIQNPDYQKKSCPVQLFLDLLEIDGVSLYSLQVGEDADKIKPYLKSDRIHDLSSLIKDFVDTACVIEQLDLVITIDTSVAHLAGAMGKPVWVLLPFVPDWRWLLERQDTPWYPTMRLFRQPQREDWKSVFAQAKEKLKVLLEEESAIFPIKEIKSASRSTSIEFEKVETFKKLDTQYLINQCTDYRTKHFEWHCQYVYDNYFQNWQPRKLPKNSDYTAVIVENRNHPLLEFAIKNTLLFTPDEVGLQIFCTSDNVDFVKNIVKNIDNTKIAVLANMPKIEPDIYSRLLKNPSFWESIPSEKILIFQYDTILTEPLDLNWFEYPYLGAPWSKEDMIEEFFLYYAGDNHKPLSRKQSVELRRAMNRKVQDSCRSGFGNGGLSIRNKQVMLDICHRYPDNSSYPEDLYFSYHVYNNVETIPDLDVAKKFCTETWFCPESIGVHASWKYLSSEKQAHFFEKHHKNVLAYFAREKLFQQI